MEVGYFEAWQLWAEHGKISERELWGLEIYWWARLSKSLGFLAIIELVVDFTGRRKVKVFARRCRRWALWIRRVLFRVLRAARKQIATIRSSSTAPPKQSNSAGLVLVIIGLGVVAHWVMAIIGWVWRFAIALTTQQDDLPYVLWGTEGDLGLLRKLLLIPVGAILSFIGVVLVIAVLSLSFAAALAVVSASIAVVLMIVATTLQQRVVMWVARVLSIVILIAALHFDILAS